MKEGEGAGEGKGREQERAREEGGGEGEGEGEIYSTLSLPCKDSNIREHHLCSQCHSLQAYIPTCQYSGHNMA